MKNDPDAQRNYSVVMEEIKVTEIIILPLLNSILHQNWFEKNETLLFIEV